MSGSLADMSGRVCVVTGANRGIGRATAAGLARLGADLVLVVRRRQEGEAVARELPRARSAAEPEVVAADLSSQRAVREAVDAIRARHPCIHVLVNNAGTIPRRRETTVDGLETQFAVNHLAPFLLTNLLLDALKAAAPSRVVIVSSGAHQGGNLDFGDLQSERRYDPVRVYGRTKLANVLFTYELAERLAGTGITANCVDPGLVATDLMREHVLFRPRWLKAVWARVLASPVAGARAAVHAASAPEIAAVTGKCFDRYGRHVRTSRQSRNPETRARLGTMSEKLTGVPFTTP